MSGGTTNKDGLVTLDNSSILPALTLTPYDYPSFEFKVSAPYGWERVEQDMGVSFISPPSDSQDSFREQMSIDILTSNVTLLEAYDNVISSSLLHSQNFTMIKAYDTCLKNENALVYLYTYLSPYDETLLKGIDVIIPSFGKSVLDFILIYSRRFLK